MSGDPQAPAVEDMAATDSVATDARELALRFIDAFNTRDGDTVRVTVPLRGS